MNQPYIIFHLFLSPEIVPVSDCMKTLCSDVCELAVLNISLVRYYTLFWMVLHVLLHFLVSDQARKEIWLLLRKRFNRFDVKPLDY